MKLLILESPSKRKTIQGFLGRDWRVEASFGHATELANDGPDNLGFDITANAVEARYVPRGKRGKQVIQKLQKLSGQAEQVFFATDPDREGEAISWHLIEQLQLPPAKVRRVRYCEITEQAVKQAIQNADPQVDQDLADAARARSVLDKLVGYKVSPLLWNSTGGKSAGRVQSAALAIVSRREKEIREFQPQPYWSLWSRYKAGFKAYFLGTEPTGESEAEGSEDDAADAGDVPAVEGRRILDQADAKRLVAIAQESDHRVVLVDEKRTTRKPPAPFTTSTLQQAAGSKLAFTTNKVMKVAQQLFEGLDIPQGRKSLITYHRTDSPVLSKAFQSTAKAWLQAHDPDNVPEQMASYRAKKGAQAAHEAIRPTYLDITPKSIKQAVTEEQYLLYKLIWCRAVAACCRRAELSKTRLVMESGGIYWEARGQVVKVAGYGKYWANLGRDQTLPPVSEGQTLQLANAAADQRKTSPPPRYTEARLVQTLEKLGVGRPSTFAATVQTLKQRKYVRIAKRKLAPTQLGTETYRLLAKTLPDLLNSEFTAEMEAVLDEIAAGNQDWQSYLCDWNRDYFQPALKEAGAVVENEYADMSNQSEKTEHKCPVCDGPLETYTYQKGSEEKTMLRCHNANTDALKDQAQEGCSDVAFFESTGAFWSPDYGEIGESNIPDDEVLEGVPCPVCGGNLEKHFYPKDGGVKSMLRCHEKKEAGCDDVAFFETDNGYWSPDHGELSDICETAAAA
jgi:DNA topoisomerase-1